MVFIDLAAGFFSPKCQKRGRRRKGAVQALMNLQTRRSVEGIPPRPSVPPERIGDGQSGFCSK